MADTGQTPTPSADPHGTRTAVDVMDVLMRGIQSAQAGLATESDDPEKAADELFCGFAYGSPGTFCPFAYWHQDAVTKEA